MRNFLRWILVFALALLLGALTVEYLVTSPERMSIDLALSLLSLAVLLFIAARLFAGAQRAGLQGLHFTTLAQLKTQLAAF